jgi:hypothetical protein
LFPPWRLDASIRKGDTSLFAAASAFLRVQLGPYADTQSATNARHDFEANGFKSIGFKSIVKR